MPGPWEKYGQGGGQVVQTKAADPVMPYKGPAAAADLRGQEIDNSTKAAIADAVRRKALADAATAEAGVTTAKVNAAKAKRPPIDPTRKVELRDRMIALANMERSLKQMEGLYRKNYQGSGLGSVAEILPDWANPANQEFNNLAKQTGPYIMSILGLNGKSTDAAAEYKQKVQPFIPSAQAFDGTNERTLKGLRDMLNTQKIATARELGLPFKTRKIADPLRGGALTSAVPKTKVIDFNDLPE